MVIWANDMQNNVYGQMLCRTQELHPGCKAMLLPSLQLFTFAVVGATFVASFAMRDFLVTLAAV
jgi:hypothetical protein